MTPALQELAILRLPDVMRLTGLGRTTVYDMMAKGMFPRPLSLGFRAVGWRTSDIRAWIETRRAV